MLVVTASAGYFVSVVFWPSLFSISNHHKPQPSSFIQVFFSVHQSNEDGPFCSAAPPSPFTLAALVTVVFVPRLSADDGRNSWSRSTAAAGWPTSSSSRRLPAPANRVVPLTIFLTRIRQLPGLLLVALGVVGVAAAAPAPSSLDAEYVPSLQLVGESSTAATATTSSPLTGSMGGGRGRSFLYRPPADDTG